MVTRFITQPSYISVISAVRYAISDTFKSVFGLSSQINNHITFDFNFIYVGVMATHTCFFHFD